MTPLVCSLGNGLPRVRKVGGTLEVSWVRGPILWNRRKWPVSNSLPWVFMGGLRTFWTTNVSFSYNVGKALVEILLAHSATTHLAMSYDINEIFYKYKRLFGRDFSCFQMFYNFYRFTLISPRQNCVKFHEVSYLAQKEISESPG